MSQKIEIKNVETQKVHYFTVKEDGEESHYMRDYLGNWMIRASESYEPMYVCGELEDAFQEWEKKNRSEDPVPGPRPVEDDLRTLRDRIAATELDPMVAAIVKLGTVSDEELGQYARREIETEFEDRTDWVQAINNEFSIRLLVAMNGLKENCLKPTFMMNEAPIPQKELNGECGNHARMEDPSDGYVEEFEDVSIEEAKNTPMEEMKDWRFTTTMSGMTVWGSYLLRHLEHGLDWDWNLVSVAKRPARKGDAK